MGWCDPLLVQSRSALLSHPNKAIAQPVISAKVRGGGGVDWVNRCCQWLGQGVALAGRLTLASWTGMAPSETS